MSLTPNEKKYLESVVEDVFTIITKQIEMDGNNAKILEKFRNLLNELLASDNCYKQLCFISLIIDIKTDIISIKDYLSYIIDVDDTNIFLKKIEDECIIPINCITHYVDKYVRLMTKYRYELHLNDITKRFQPSKVITNGWGFKGAFTPPKDDKSYIKKTMLWVTPKIDFDNYKEILLKNGDIAPASGMVRFLALPWYKKMYSPDSLMTEVFMLEYSTTFNETLYQPNTTMGDYGYSFNGRYCSYNNKHNLQYGETCNIHNPDKCAKERIHLNYHHYDAGYLFTSIGNAELLDTDESEDLIRFAYKRLESLNK